MKITRAIAKKVLATVDAGLVKGLGEQAPGQMCVEAAVCYALGLPHGDDPVCVSPALRRLKITLNDCHWSSPFSRAKGLRRLALIQLGSAGVIDEIEFNRKCADLAVRKIVPLALRAAASLQDEEPRQRLMGVAIKCESEGDAAAACAAATAAHAIVAAAFDCSTAYAVTHAIRAADAAARAADAAARAADAAARAAARAAFSAADAAAAAAAADAAAAFSDAAARTAYACAARDKVLSEFAEEVVQILISMKTPGVKWLVLT